MSAPKRIQRKRTKGWRMPPNTVKVDRSTRWGNPFMVWGENEYLYCDASHRRKILTPWVIFDHDQPVILGVPATPQMAVDHFRRWLTYEFDAAGVVRPCLIRSQLEKLRGKNLACWCDLSEACHADVLLELANA